MNLRWFQRRRKAPQVPADQILEQFVGTVDVLCAGTLLLVESGVTDWKTVVDTMDTVLGQQMAQDGGQRDARAGAAWAIRSFAAAHVAAEAEKLSKHIVN